MPHRNRPNSVDCERRLHIQYYAPPAMGMVRFMVRIKSNRTHRSKLPYPSGMTFALSTSIHRLPDHVHRLCQRQTAAVWTQTSLLADSLAGNWLPCAVVVCWPVSSPSAAVEGTVLHFTAAIISLLPVCIYDVRSHGFALPCNSAFVNTFTPTPTPPTAASLGVRPAPQLRTDCPVPPSPMVFASVLSLQRAIRRGVGNRRS